MRGHHITPNELRILMDRHNLTMRAAAEIAIVGESTIKAWLNGRGQESAQGPDRLRRYAAMMDKIDRREGNGLALITTDEDTP